MVQVIPQDGAETVDTEALNQRGLEERKRLIRGLLTSGDPHIPEEWLTLEAQHYGGPENTFASDVDKIVELTAVDESNWQKFTRSFLQRFPEKKGKWPPEDFTPVWAGNGLKPGGESNGPGFKAKVSVKGCLRAFAWRLCAYTFPILDVGEKAGRLSWIRVTAWIVLVIFGAILLGSVFGYAIPQTKKCNGFVEAVCELDQWSLELTAQGATSKSNTEVGYILFQAPRVCDTRNLTCQAVQRPVIHRCGPSHEFTKDKEAEDWLFKHDISIPGNHTCFIKPRRGVPPGLDVEVNEGDIVLMREGNAFSVAVWFWMVIGLIGVPILYGLVFCAKPISRDLCHVCCVYFCCDDMFDTDEDSEFTGLC